MCVYVYIYIHEYSRWMCMCMHARACARTHMHTFCLSLHNDWHDCNRWIVFIFMLCSDYWQGFALVIGFIDHFNKQLVITHNYSAIANFRSLQFTRAHAKAFPAHSVFSSSCLVMASNSGCTSGSVLKSSVNGSSLPTVTLATPTKSSVHRLTKL
jgi:hypothetical protein